MAYMMTVMETVINQQLQRMVLERLELLGTEDSTTWGRSSITIKTSTEATLTMGGQARMGSLSTTLVSSVQMESLKAVNTSESSKAGREMVKV